MDVYGTQSRGPQKHSTDIQLFMIRIDHDTEHLTAFTLDHGAKSTGRPSPLAETTDTD